MRLRATRLTAVASAVRAAIAQVANPFAGAAAMYGMRIPVGSTYSGPLLRVRRSSDNAEQDIGVGATDANGNKPLDVAALLTFCGSANGFVTTWYDQSGNARNATQAAAASQPRIVNAGVLETLNSKPTVNFLGGQRLALSVSLPAAFSISHVAKANSITSYSRTLSGLSDMQLYVGQINGNYGTGTGTGSGWVSLGVNSPATSVVEAAKVLSLINDKTTTGLVPRVNGVAQAAKNGTGAAISGLYIGGDVQLWQGQISEVAVWATALTTPVCQDIERNQGAYYGITIA